MVICNGLGSLLRYGPLILIKIKLGLFLFYNYVFAAKQICFQWISLLWLDTISTHGLCGFQNMPIHEGL